MRGVLAIFTSSVKVLLEVLDEWHTSVCYDSTRSICKDTVLNPCQCVCTVLVSSIVFKCMYDFLVVYSDYSNTFLYGNKGNETGCRPFLLLTILAADSYWGLSSSSPVLCQIFLYETKLCDLLKSERRENVAVIPKSLLREYISKVDKWIKLSMSSP